MNDEQDSIDIQASLMRRQRERLAAFKHYRQRAVAEFPLRVANVAKDLSSLCDMRDKFGAAVMNDDTEAAMQYMEDQIRFCYRQMFGTELGQ
jgi:hypothetical protein